MWGFFSSLLCNDEPRVMNTPKIGKMFLRSPPKTKKVRQLLLENDAIFEASAFSLTFSSHL